MLPVYVDSSMHTERLPTLVFGCVINVFTMSINPYVTQICEQTGMTEWEVNSQLPRTIPTLDYVRKLGFHTVDDYLEDLHEFLNGQ